MKNHVKKIMSIMFVGCMLTMTVINAGAVVSGETGYEFGGYDETSGCSVESKAIETRDLTHIAVGDIVYIGDIAIEKVSDDDNGPCETSRKTKKGFTVNLDGQTEASETLELSKDYRYFYIWINNTGKTDIIMTIGNDPETEEKNFYKLGKGKHYVYSTNKWSAEDQNVSFTQGGKMYGQASSRLCSTLKEAQEHNG